MKLHTVAAAVLALASLTAASLPAHAQTAAPAAAAAAAVDHKAVAAHYAALVHANYADTLAAAKDLQAAIAEFTKAPSADGLTKARKAWLILYTHDVAEEPSQWGCTTGALERLIDRAKADGFDVVTVAEGARRIGL